MFIIPDERSNDFVDSLCHMESLLDSKAPSRKTHEALINLTEFLQKTPLNKLDLAPLDGRVQSVINHVESVSQNSKKSNGLFQKIIQFIDGNLEEDLKTFSEVFEEKSIELASKELRKASEIGDLQQVQGLLTNSNSKIPFLLKALNKQGSYGVTALILASRNGHLEVVTTILDFLKTNTSDPSLFLEAINLLSCEKKTAIMYAREGSFSDIVQVLLDVGSKFHLKHGDLLALLRVLYPKFSKEGVCHGIDLIAMERAFSGNFKQFKELLEKLASIFNEYPHYREYDSPAKQIVEKMKQGSLKERNDFRSFLEGLWVCQEGGGDLCQDLLQVSSQTHKNFTPSALSLIASESLERKGKVVELEDLSFSGSYTLPELNDYFKSLEEVLLQEPKPQTPMALMITSTNHATCFGYEPEELFFVDANQLHVINVPKISACALHLNSAFSEKPCSVSTRVFTILPDSEEVVKIRKEITCLYRKINKEKKKKLPHLMNSKNEKRNYKYQKALQQHLWNLEKKLELAIQANTKEKDLDVKFWEERLTAWQNTSSFKGIHEPSVDSDKNLRWLRVAAKSDDLRSVKKILATETKKTNPWINFRWAEFQNKVEKLFTGKKEPAKKEDSWKTSRVYNPHGEDPSMTPLMFASQRENLGIVNALLEAGVDMNQKNSDGQTAFMMASERGSLEIVSSLLKAGVDINQEDSNGKTAFMKASEHGQLEIVKLLLEKGVDLNKVGSKGHTALMRASVAGDLKMVKFLLEKGADVNQKTSLGSALRFAAIGKNPEIISLLLEAGADVDGADSNGCTALYEASNQGSLENLKILLKAGADPNKQRDDGWTPLIIASTKGHLEIVKLLLENKAEINRQSKKIGPALLQASQNGRLEVVNVLLSAGADVNIQDFKGETALMGTSQEVRAVLLKAGADVNKQDFKGKTALMHCSEWGSPESVLQLLAAGADVNIQDFEGKTALEMASSRENSAVVAVLKQ